MHHRTCARTRAIDRYCAVASFRLRESSVTRRACGSRPTSPVTTIGRPPATVWRYSPVSAKRITGSQLERISPRFLREGGTGCSVGSRSESAGEKSSQQSARHWIEFGNCFRPFAVNVRIEVIDDPGVRNALVQRADNRLPIGGQAARVGKKPSLGEASHRFDLRRSRRDFDNRARRVFERINPVAILGPPNGPKIRRDEPLLTRRPRKNPEPSPSLRPVGTVPKHRNLVALWREPRLEDPAHLRVFHQQLFVPAREVADPIVACVRRLPR